jgi:hypothetical protein
MTDNAPLNINIDLSNVVTTIPLVADNTQAKVRLKNVTQNDRDGTPIIRWELVLTEPAPTADGGEVKPGFPLYVNFDTSQDWLMQKMSRFVDGLLGTGDKGNTKGKPARPPFNSETVSQMLGREGVARIIVTRSKKSDYVGNDVATLTFPNDLVS